MFNRSIKFLLTVLAFALLPVASAAAAGPSGAVVFSRAIATSEKTESGTVEKVEGGLYAAKGGRLNQLTENPADSEPDFSPDGRRIAFVRGGDIWTMRADGTGQHMLTGGPEVDGRPQFAPSGRYLVFERRAPGTERPRDLYTVRLDGSGLRELVSFVEDLHEATFSPDGRLIAFVRSMPRHDGGFSDDIYSVRPSGRGLKRLTLTYRVDEFSPRYFRGGVVFSRGQSDEGSGAYADVYTMRRNGLKPRPLIRGAGSAFVEDVAPSGTAVLFRRDQGLWTKRIGRGRARKLSQVADNSATNSVFSSDGRRVAAFIATEDAESLSAIDVATRRSAELAEGFSLESGSTATSIGPVIAWQPVRR
jgi:tricorn protease-like protein